jgi:epoxyqueuosine reductase
MSLSATALKSYAAAAGFDLCGIAAVDPPPSRLGFLRDWIARGYAGDMDYLSRSIDERLDPRRVLPTAQSVVCVACVYQTPAPLSIEAPRSGVAVISRYAWGDDYHDVLRPRLRALIQWMQRTAGPGFEACSLVDAGPIQEKAFAVQAGLGWMGKHTCVIHPQRGSWMVLGVVLTNAVLEADTPGVDHCGTCTRCLEACPTGAIVEPYVLDATRCLSYLTIERRGMVDSRWRSAVGREVFGCDICQDVCPWNRRAPASDDPVWQPRAGLAFPSILDLCAVTDDEWRARLKGSAMRRAGLRRIRESLAYGAAQLAEPDRSAALDMLAAHPSGQTDTVSAAIAWARATAEGLA